MLGINAVLMQTQTNVLGLGRIVISKLSGRIRIVILKTGYPISSPFSIRADSASFYLENKSSEKIAKKIRFMYRKSLIIRFEKLHHSFIYKFDQGCVS